MDSAFWKGKKVLITGHTGFKGSWLALWLSELGAQVTGYALDPGGEKGNFRLAKVGERIRDIRGDIRDEQRLKEAFQTSAPEVVFHLAAQSLVREGYHDPRRTYDVNLMGTLSVLENIRREESVKAAVIVTTDKCYENKEDGRPFQETDPLGGHDPYSASKACAEILIASWRSSFLDPAARQEHAKAVATARAGNVIGGGDWGTDRIVPDFIRAMEQGQPVCLRNPAFVRPWQHVLEALSGYMLLAQRLTEDPAAYAQGWNFGPEPEGVASVEELVGEMNRYAAERGKKTGVLYEKGKIQPREAGILLLDITKASQKLGWKPVLTLSQCVRMTMDWYLCYQKEDIYEIDIAQIKEYTKIVTSGVPGFAANSVPGLEPVQ